MSDLQRIAETALMTDSGRHLLCFSSCSEGYAHLPVTAGDAQKWLGDPGRGSLRAQPSPCVVGPVPGSSLHCFIQKVFSDSCSAGLRACLQQRGGQSQPCQLWELGPPRWHETPRASRTGLGVVAVGPLRSPQKLRKSFSKSQEPVRQYPKPGIRDLEQALSGGNSGNQRPSRVPTGGSGDVRSPGSSEFSR